jgi:polar amino acid transport system substrate-binding protein
MTKGKIAKFIALLMVIVMALAAWGCSKKDTNSTASQTAVEKIKKAGKIVVGTSADYPPYEFHKQINGNDQIVGFDIDTANEIAKDLGVKLEIKDMKFDGLLAALDSGNVDFVIAGMTPDAERRKQVDFSKVYYKAIQGVVTRVQDKDSVKDAASLSGKKIGVQKGSVQEKIANTQIKGAKVKALGNVSDLILELKNGKVDAVIIELPVANAYIANNSDIALTNLTFTDEEGGSAVAIKKGNADLVNQIDSTLDRLMKKNAIDGFFANWSKELEK